MNSVRLIPMTEARYAAYMAEHREDYAAERVVVDYLTPEEASEKVRKQTETLLPQGVSTPQHHFFDVVSETETVGHVWLKVDPVERLAWLYHLFVLPAFRRRGYGRAALDLAAEKSRELGARVFWLNVFADNHAARALYRSWGLKEAAVHMNCLL